MKFRHLKYVFILQATLQLTNAVAQERLSLADAAALAASNNLELKASRMEIDIARQERNVARSLFLPMVSLSGQANHYFKRIPFFGFGAESSQDKIPYGRFGGEDQFAAGITAVQPLYNPIAGPSVKLAGLSSQKSELGDRSARIEVAAEVRQTYLLILVLEERIKLEQESIRRNERVLRDARSLFLQGKALRVDTLRAYTSIKNLEPQILKLQYAVESAKLRLQTLTGITSTNLVLTDSLHVQVPVVVHDEREVYESALRDNPEFQLLKVDIELNKQNINSAVAAKRPVVSAVGQYQVLSQMNRFEFGDAYYPTASFVGIQLYLPLFTGLSNQSKYRIAELRSGQSEVHQQYVVEQLRSRVHEVVAQNHESMERLKTALSVRETATLGYEIIQYRYQKGIASRLELSDAEFELSSAKSNYLEAVYDYLSSEIEIAKLTGRE